MGTDCPQDCPSMPTLIVVVVGANLAQSLAHYVSILTLFYFILLCYLSLFH